MRHPAPDLGRLPEVTAALAARAEEHDRAGSFPADGIGIVHAAGLLTATVAERYGGPGGRLAETVTILHALGRGDPSVALITAMTLFQRGPGLADRLPDRADSHSPRTPAGYAAAVPECRR